MDPNSSGTNMNSGDHEIYHLIKDPTRIQRLESMVARMASAQQQRQQQQYQSQAVNLSQSIFQHQNRHQQNTSLNRSIHNSRYMDDFFNDKQDFATHNSVMGINTMVNNVDNLLQSRRATGNSSNLSQAVSQSWGTSMIDQMAQRRVRQQQQANLNNSSVNSLNHTRTRNNNANNVNNNNNNSSIATNINRLTQSGSNSILIQIMQITVNRSVNAALKLFEWNAITSNEFNTWKSWIKKNLYLWRDYSFAPSNKRQRRSMQEHNHYPTSVRFSIVIHQMLIKNINHSANNSTTKLTASSNTTTSISISRC